MTEGEPSSLTYALDLLNLTSTQSTASNMTDNSPTPDSEEAAPPTHFRFMDLPAEIRNRVYSHALPGTSNTYSRRVADFRFPAITRVSRQTRQEALPLLFADTNFIFSVGTNCVSRLANNPRREKRRAGTLSFTSTMQRCIKDAGDSAVFRNVTLHVHDSSDMRAKLGVSEGVLTRLLLTLTLTVEQGKLRANVVEENLYPRRSKGFSTVDDVEALEEVVQGVFAIARGISAREEFKGFAMADLKRIAKGFRVG